MSPRNAELEKQYVREMTRLGEFVTTLNSEYEPEGLAGGWLREIRVLYPTEDRTDVLLVVKASSEEGNFVGFVGGLTLAAAIATWRAKDGREGLRWREDLPWEDRKGGAG